MNGVQDHIKTITGPLSMVNALNKQHLGGKNTQHSANTTRANETTTACTSEIGARCRY